MLNVIQKHIFGRIIQIIGGFYQQSNIFHSLVQNYIELLVLLDKLFLCIFRG